MVSRDVESGSDAAPSVTPMSEIRRYRSIRLEEFTHINPGWVWSEERRQRLMCDEQGCLWVPMFSPEDGLYLEYDPLYTPEAEARLEEIAQKAYADALAGRVTSLDELDDEEDDLQCAFELP